MGERGSYQAEMGGSMEGARGEGAGCSGTEAGCAGPGQQGESGSGRSLCGMCKARGCLRLLQGAATARMLMRMLAWWWWLGLPAVADGMGRR